MIFEMNQPDLGGDIAPRPGSFQSRSAAPVRLTTAAPRLIKTGPGPASHEDMVLFNGRKIPREKLRRNSAKAGASGRGHKARLRKASERAFGNFDF